MKHRIWINLALVFGLLTSYVGAVPPEKSVAQAPTAAVLYVTESGSSSNDCRSWTQACDLQTALIKAVGGDEIWVAAGTYRPTARVHAADSRSATFAVKRDVALYGGFAGAETSREQRDWETHVTILSGDIGVEGDASDNSYHVVTLGNIFRQISAGSFHTCGLRLDGSLACWGGDSSGRVSGPNNSTDIFAQVSAGYGHTCGLKTDGRLACWGADNFGQVSGPNNSIDTFTQVSAGGFFTCGVRNDDRLVCWGSDFSGQVSGPNNSTDTFIQVSAGHDHTCGTDAVWAEYGYVHCWGRNDYGQATPPDTIVTQVSAGETHTCAVQHDAAHPIEVGDLVCWGADLHGQVSGPNNSTDKFIQVSAGYMHTCAVQDGGRLACWGSDSQGQVSGPNNSTDKFIQVSAGFNHTCGLRDDGGVECWGSDLYGQASPPSGTDPAGAILDGFTISGGRSGRVGGGLINVGTSPVLENLTFSGNDAVRGGGMSNKNGNPKLTNVTFGDNSAPGQGGGLYNQGGSPTLVNVTFSNNSASEGGGVFNDSSSPTLVNVTFSGNVAGSNGGGMYNDTGNPSLANVVFSGNAAGGNGGGMVNTGSSPALVNVTFSGNAAVGSGGGMYNQGGSPTVDNAILWGNTAPIGAQIHNDGSSPTLSFSLVQGSGGSGPYDVFAVGSDGTILHDDGSGWSAMSSGTGVDLTGVWGSGLCDVFAVGWYGTILHYDGSGWSAMSSGTGVYLTGVWGSGPNDVFAVGSGGTILHYDGSGWSAMSSGTSEILTGVWGSGPNDVFTIGWYGTILHYDGSGWSAISSGTPEHLNGVWGSGPNDVFAVGIGHTILHYDGSGWSAMSSGTSWSLNGVWGRGPSDVFAIGWYGTIVHDDGSGWSAMSSGTGADLTGVWGSGPNDVFAVGRWGTILHYDGSGWSAMSSGTGENLEDVWSIGGWPTHLGTDGGGNIDQDPLFVRQPDSGSDGAWGTPDDDYGDLRLQLASPAIDAGDESALPADSLDLDGDSDTAEPLPIDLDGNPRVLYAAVDMGAYEEHCFFSAMAQGGTSLSLGREYRAGFHAELDGPASVTISDTLASYDVAGLTPLTEGKQAYGQALVCAKTVTQTDQALTGLLDAHWELATGAMLTGNQELVQALDVEFSPVALDDEIQGLQEAIRWYTQATEGYIPLLAGQHHTRVLALQPSRVDPLTGEEMPYLDLQRLALAAAKKSRAYLELAERQFRRFTPDSKAQAEQTLRRGFDLAIIELTLLAYLWDGAVDDVSYQALQRNMADMQRLYDYRQAGKNPYGYGPEYVPFHFQPKRLPDNNYEQTKTLADVEFEEASTQVENALGRQQEIDDDFRIMQQRLADIGEQYDGQLVGFCGLNADNGPDLAKCHENVGGEIYRQLLRIQAAAQRLELVQQQMSNQNALIRIEQRRAAQVAGIQRATAEMWTETGEKLADLAAQEVNLRESQSDAQGFLSVLGGVFSGASGLEESFGGKGMIAGGVIGGLLEVGNHFAQKEVAEDLAEVAAKRERLQSMQWAQVHYAEAQITNAESEALIKQYMLRFAEYDIEYSIALNNLQQELARLNGMRAQVEYLLAEKAKATAFTEALYQDPAARVLRDYYMELAHDRFEVAMHYTYQAGRALEYEISQEAIFSDGPLTTLDSVYRIRDIYTLDAALAQMNTAYHDWLARDDIPSPHLREDVIYLSQALGFEDTYDPDLDRIVTREEKFNAFVRDPANWVDLDQDGTKESLGFTFQTSIYLGNRFFSTRVFNDKIASIKMCVRGQNLGDDRAVIQLKQGGTSLVRGQNAFKFGGPDDIRTYNLPPIEASIMASTNENALPDEIAINRELATRSVAFTNWTVTLDMVHEPNNFDLDLEGIEEIELIVTHEAYTLQDTGVMSGQGEEGVNIFEPPPNREYRPIEATADHPLPIASLKRSDSTLRLADIHTQDVTPDLNDTYVGTAVISQPPYMPPLDLVVVLSDTNGSLSGYVDATQGLSYPIVDEGRGPAVSGWWSGNSFYLQSEVFTTVMTTGVEISRQVVLHTGVISDSGEILTGVYSQTLTGLTADPMVILGEFKLYRPSHALLADFSASPASGIASLTVTFTDLSSGSPTGWAWTFGDGATSTAQHTTHTYHQTGTYTVTLTVSNAFGSDTKVDANCVSVQPGPGTIPIQPVIFLPMVMRESQ